MVLNVTAGTVAACPCQQVTPVVCQVRRVETVCSLETGMACRWTRGFSGQGLAWKGCSLHQPCCCVQGGPAKRLQERPPSPQSAPCLIWLNKVNPSRRFHLQHFPRENKISSSWSVLHSASLLSAHLNQKEGLKNRAFLFLKALIRCGAGKNALPNTGMFILQTAGVHSPQQ